MHVKHGVLDRYGVATRFVGVRDRDKEKIICFD